MSNSNRAPHQRHDRGRSSIGGEQSILESSARQLDAFSRKVTATAGHLIGGGEGIASHYQVALNDLHRELRHPLVQRKVFSLSQASPKEILRARLSTNEIQHRALTYIPDDILLDVPKTNNAFSLFQGFQATLPDPADTSKRKPTGRRGSRGRKAIADREDSISTPHMAKLNQDKVSMTHKLEMLTIRKNMCSTEIHEIDNKIANLNTMRKLVLDRLAGLEQEEAQLENDLLEVDTKIEDMQEELEDAAALAKGQKTPPSTTETRDESVDVVSLDSPIADSPSFMSQSIYEKIPSPKVKRSRPTRRKSNFILHEHLQAGSQIRELQAHNDVITALDFDVPFGTMVTAALDDTVRVWDLNAGRCIGLLEGHLSSVRCLQVEDNLVATGSLDASVRLWDLSQADYTPLRDTRINKDSSDEDDDYTFADHPAPTASSMADCEIFNLSSHVAEVTALHFHNSTLVSGSADKTLRQWDLTTGRCVQTMDVMWAAAQAAININVPSANSTNNNTSLFGAPLADPGSSWRQTGRTPDSNADFVGAVQCFDAALACGTADGMVRLWDLRSGQVHRSLVGHTGPVTCLQFDDVHMVTGSLDRSVRIWDLRTGTIYDAFGYDNPITSMMFDARRIVAAAGEAVVKVYDKTDGRQWDCGAGAISSSTAASGGAVSSRRSSATVDDMISVETGMDVGLDQLDGGEMPAVKGSGGGGASLSVVERVRIKDGFLVEGRRDGVVGVWSC